MTGAKKATRGRGRPPKAGVARDRVLQVRVTKGEAEALKQSAEVSAVSVSEFLRGMVLMPMVKGRVMVDAAVAAEQRVVEQVRGEAQAARPKGQTAELTRVLRETMRANPRLGAVEVALKVGSGWPTVPSEVVLGLALAVEGEVA